MIRIGVVGLGKMGASHLAMIRAHPDVSVDAVVDSTGYVLDVLSKYTGLRTFTDFDTMLKEVDLDAVIIATPTRAARADGKGGSWSRTPRVLREAALP